MSTTKGKNKSKLILKNYNFFFLYFKTFFLGSIRTDLIDLYDTFIFFNEKYLRYKDRNSIKIIDLCNYKSNAGKEFKDISSFTWELFLFGDV